MLLVAIAKLQKLINWAQVVFSNLHSRLRDLFATIKQKKMPWEGDGIWWSPSHRYHPSTLVSN